jgi:hypothetical protein
LILLKKLLQGSKVNTRQRNVSDKAKNYQHAYGEK